MIARLEVPVQISSQYLEFIDALKHSSFTGDIDASYSARLSVATDNSIYQKLPQAIVFPKSVEDVQALCQLSSEAQFESVRFSARGGGTGTNGQSLTDGIIVDFSRHMNQILEINENEGWVRVQTGVVKDQLNAFLKPYGYFFSPDLSTSNRATLGGMINTDASGQGSLVYGKTSDHVLGLKSVLANGDVLDTAPMPIDQAKDLAKGDSAVANIYQQAISTCTKHRDAILAKFPRLNRFLTGYDLEHVYSDDMSNFDLGRLLTGSEGTLAMITEAKLNLTPIPNFKTLINVKYDSFDAALRSAPTLVKANATSVETIDSNVLNLAKDDIIWHSVSDVITVAEGEDLQGINIVEITAVEESEIKSKLAVLTQLLDELKEQGKGVFGYQVTSDPDSIGRIYAMRKKAVGLLGATKGAKKPVAFAEDTAVPPENLADFIGEFRKLLDDHGLKYGMFGHVDAGVLHVRPAMDMCDPEQEVLLRSISDKVVALTAKYGGLMWGEHGKGYRSEYGPAFFGDALFSELRKIKSAFDPLNKMNPGKICTPYESDENLVSVDDTKRGYFDRQIDVKVKESFVGAMDCNGNGLCFNYDTTSPMCPSFKATGDRIHSPKGRAGIVREWLRLQSDNGVNVVEMENMLKSPTGGLSNRLAQAIRTDSAEYQDFNHEVKASLDGCLACKACSTQCPIKVDVPTFRSRFLFLYHSIYKRPMKDFLVAGIEKMAPVLSRMAPLVNWGSNLGLTKKLIESTVGYIDAPSLSSPSLAKRSQSDLFKPFDFQELSKMTDKAKQRYVLIVQDTFTSFYEAELIEELASLLNKLNYTPILLPFKANGKPQHVKGFLREFRDTATDTANFLNEVAKLNIPMIGADSSMTLCYRSEYPKELGEDKVDFKVYLVHEWFARELASSRIPKHNIGEKDAYQLDRKSVV